MNTLLSVRTNIVYAKKKKQDEKAEDEFVRHQELIFLVDKPTYRYSNEAKLSVNVDLMKSDLQFQIRLLSN